MDTETDAKEIVDAAVKVHRALGPDLLESAYQQCLMPIHEAQIMTYLKLRGKPIGFLFNWNVPVVKQGMKRILYNYTPEVRLFGPR